MQRQEFTVSNPHIKTELPGPKARAMLERDKPVSSPSYPRDYPFVMSHGRGTEVWDVDGNRFLDFMSGIAVCATGHAHPKVVEAVKAAADKFLHISSDYWHENFTALCERLARHAPMGEPVMSFLGNSGTEAVEGAIKLARYVTGRPRFLGFIGSFHGRTMGSLSFTSSKYTQQKGFAPTMPGVTHVPYPNTYRPLLAGADQGKAVLDYIRMLFERNVPPSEVAAILVEPIQGEGGYLVPPDGFLAGLRALCDEHGILLIFDEVQSGVGRTGKMWASQHWGVKPDIMTSAKGLGSGMPIGAFIARESIWTWPPGAHGSTFAGNPVCAAAALATLDVIEAEGLANAAAMGDRLRQGLERVATDAVRDIRGAGLMIGVEFGSHEVAEAVQEAAFRLGLLTLECGEASLRFSPPLIVTAGEVDIAVDLFAQSLTAARHPEQGIAETGG